MELNMEFDCQALITLKASRRLRPSDPQFLSTKNFKILSMHIPIPIPKAKIGQFLNR